MACTLNTGRKLPCKSAFGGIKTVWFGDFGGITGVTVDSTTKQLLQEHNLTGINLM